jgi:hypothetical protein
MDKREILLELIYKKSKLKISTKSDCNLLSSLIYKDIGSTLSESTLYRVLIKKENPLIHYKNTLNIISRYCGFSDWDNFENYTNNTNLFNNSTFLNNIFETTIEKLIEDNKFNNIIDIFETTKESNYKTKEFIGLYTFKGFKKFSTFSNFIKKYGSNSFVRQILIEALYDPHHRLHSYTEGIKFYLKATPKSNSNYLQDIIFAQTVLFRHFYKTGEYKQMISIGHLLYNSINYSSEIEKIHLFRKIRFNAYKIYHIILKNESPMQAHEYISVFLNWIEFEIQKVHSLIELNILYQTTKEVLIDLNLIQDLNILNTFYNKKLLDFKFANSSEVYNNANGLLNLINE